ncbi:hypothetical protein ASPWEDRAFT_119408 [Aspergillus wentii DTO 134E9]|uniref:Glucose-methanol-choline oxidoreductase N-terminal domain-containing protein n=1 Tax=Aspergillus wentii DTO 134E9 TaxID=1073089 RepID=A0A1L9R7E2_ASPWE|nr:uncharacterized protein ASPWEDRAFT_119408 [Aspergillus wentii DTO 134E9]OJJ30841.1 hypothetical protein ASPWEDRAFT_119408 [Aspergillus wentii DTO 134E9]
MATERAEYRFSLVIVGAGAAGCVLASRISEARPDTQILLIEAGVGRDERVIPAAGYLPGMGSDIEWNYRSEPQTSFADEDVSLTSGKIVGGSSAVNFQCFTRGPSVNYNQWADLVGDERWSWKNLLPYFKKSEAWTPSQAMIEEDTPTEDLHGANGPIKVTHVTNSGKPRKYPLRNKIQEFHEILGQQKIVDLNGGFPRGYAECASSHFNGFRSFATSYKLGDNVTVWTESVVEQVIMNGKKAEGVLVTRVGEKGERVRAMADKEVILSAGTQASPKILMLSGVGPKSELDRHNIPQIANLPVGENYAEHPTLSMYWTVGEANATLGGAEPQTPECDWLAGIPFDWQSFSPADESTRAKAKEELSAPDYQQYIADGKVQMEVFVNPIPGWPGKRTISLVNVLVDPLSRGTIKLRSSNPFDAPILDPKLLSSPVDRSAFYESVRTTAAAIQKVHSLGAVEFGVDEDLRKDWSDKAVETRIKRSGGTVYHPSGTCAMGSVVDTECRVLGIEALRVVDASVFTIPLAAHYQAPTYAIAEQMADIILDSF